MSGDRGGYMQTFTGRRFFAHDPRPEDFCIEDIARALSMMCRFGGHLRRFYSVAQHSVLCAEMAPEPFKLDALLHDRSEAYIADIVKPAKPHLPDYMAMEQRIERVSAPVFAVAHPMPAEVKLVDCRMLVTEASQLVQGENHWWLESGMPPGFSLKIRPWSPDRAMREFLGAYERLRRV